MVHGLGFAREKNMNQTTHDAVSLDDAVCPACDYNLRGLTGDRCPECGFELARLTTEGGRIAWVRRRELGAWRAYWRTAWALTIRPGRTLDALPEVASPAEASRFRWITVGIATAVSLLVLACFVVLDEKLRKIPLGDWYYYGLFFLAGVLSLAAMTGLPGYLFHNRRLPRASSDRAVALSYYACAPAALLIFLAPFYLLACGYTLSRGFDWNELPWGLIVFGGLAFVRWYGTLIQLSRRTQPRVWRTVSVILFTPLLWLLSTAFLFFFVPTAGFLIGLYAYTLCTMP